MCGFVFAVRVVEKKRVYSAAGEKTEDLLRLSLFLGGSQKLREIREKNIRLWTSRLLYDSFSGGGYFSASENVLASLRRAAPRLRLVVWVPHNGVSAPREGTPSFYARVRTFVPVVTCSITCATPPGVTGSPSPPVFHEDFAACTPRLTVVSYYSRFWVRTTDIEEVSEPGPSSVVEITRETSMGRIAVWARDGEASSNAINPGVYFG